jgi:hypothetical protein
MPKIKMKRKIFSHIFPVYLLGGKMPNFEKKKKIGEKKIPDWHLVSNARELHFA